MNGSKGWLPENEGSSAPFWSALRIGVLYAVAVSLAATWIVLSDPVIGAWVRGPSDAPFARLAMGGAFVLGSAVVVAALSYRELRERWARARQHRSLIDQDLAGISVVQDGAFRFVNHRFAEMFGYAPDEIVDPPTPVGDLIAPDERGVVAEHLRRRVAAEVDDVRYRYTGLKKGGDKVRVEVHGRRIEWDGAPAVMSLHLDVTEEERLREEALRSQRLEALGELTGAVAHDFNNLLTTIVAPLDLCEGEVGPDHPIRPELEEAKAGAKRAVTLTQQLLAFSRRRIHRSRPMDMGELIRLAEPMLRRLVPAGVRIDLDLADDLPTVEADPSHIEQVLLNLVTNAVEAVGGRGRISIKAYAGAPGAEGLAELVVEVSDDGKGMDAETSARIFEPFFTTRADGTGLGLSTAHGIVKQASGELSVDSTLGVGTTFVLRLPGTEQPAEPLEGEASDRKESARSPSERRSVLVVDDEDGVRRVTARVLERHGLEVRAAATAEDALAVIGGENARVDVLLTDLGLPDMNGVDLAERAREAHPDISVLYMSGHSDELVLKRLARERSSGFIEKPFSVEGLLHAVGSTTEDEGGGPLDAEVPA
ncbi:MAG: response regulator [Gemmatimonadota bacterium]|nr:response regulator [Gemmatimonadota bacterium]